MRPYVTLLVIFSEIAHLLLLHGAHFFTCYMGPAVFFSPYKMYPNMERTLFCAPSTINPIQCHVHLNYCPIVSLLLQDIFFPSQ